MSTVDIDKQIEDFVAEYYHRWVKWGYYGNPEKLDEDTEYTQACDFIKNLLSTQRTHLKAELLAKMPKVSARNKNGKLRPFSTKTVWEYSEVYVKAEANYRAKAIKVIEETL